MATTIVVATSSVVIPTVASKSKEATDVRTHVEEVEDQEQTNQETIQMEEGTTTDK